MAAAVTTTAAANRAAHHNSRRGTAPAASPANDKDVAMRTTLFVLIVLCCAAPAAGEAFVPAADAVPIELRGEARVTGQTVLLRQIGHLPPENAKLGQTVVATLGRGKYTELDAADVADALRAAGISPAAVRLLGARRCLVTRLDAAYDEAAQLRAWADAEPAAAPAPAGPVRELRDVLVEDAADRLAAEAGNLSVNFEGDDRLLGLPDGPFVFEVDRRRGRGLGRCAWDVTITRDGTPERHVVEAIVGRTIRQPVLARAVAAGEPIDAADVRWREVTLDRDPPTPPATADDLAGAAAARALDAGAVLDRRAIRPIPLVRRGQFVSVLISRGGVIVKAVATALEDATAGQAVRLRDEATRSTYTALVTGPGRAALGQTY